MPNVLHIECACGHSATIEVKLEDDHHEIMRRLRCSTCGRLGAIKDFRLGWMDQGAWDRRKGPE